MKVKIIIILLCLIATGVVLVMGRRRTEPADPNTQLIQNAFQHMQDRKESIHLPQNDKTLTVNVGSELIYADNVHGSVGSSWSAEFDKSAFKAEYSTKYDDPDYDNPDSPSYMCCGGDSATQTAVFKALKKGRYTIKIIYDFRGETERIVTFTVSVK